MGIGYFSEVIILKQGFKQTNRTEVCNSLQKFIAREKKKQSRKNPPGLYLASEYVKVWKYFLLSSQQGINFENWFPLFPCKHSKNWGATKEKKDGNTGREGIPLMILFVTVWLPVLICFHRGFPFISPLPALLLLLSPSRSESSCASLEHHYIAGQSQWWPCGILRDCNIPRGALI